MDITSAARAVALLLTDYGLSNRDDEAQDAVLVAEFAQRVPDETNAKAVIERCLMWYPNKLPNVAQLRAAMRDVRPVEPPPELPEPQDDPEVIKAAREAALAKIKTFGVEGRQREAEQGEGPSTPHTRSTLRHALCQLGADHEGKCLPPPYLDDRRYDR